MSVTKEEIVVTGTDKTRAMVNSVNRGLRDIGSSARGIASSLGLASAVSVAGLGAIAKRAIDLGDKIQKLSIQYQTSTEFMSRMGHVAELADVSLEEVGKAIQFIQRSAAEAHDGQKKYLDSYAALNINVEEFIRSYAALNINVEEFIRLQPEQQFLLLTERLNQVGNASQRTKLAMDIMGRSGTTMLRVMDEGTDAIKEMWQESDRMGMTLSRVQADQMAEFNDTLTRMKNHLTGFTVQAVGPAIDFLMFWADRLGIVKTSLNSLELGEVNVRIEDLNTRINLLNESMKRTPSFAEWGTGDFDVQAIDRAQAEVAKLLPELAALLKRKQEMEQELLQGPKAADKLGGLLPGAAEKQQVSEVQKLIQALQQEAATFGLTQEQIALYKLQLAGATAEELQHAAVLAGRIESYREFGDLVKTNADAEKERAAETEKNTAADAALVAELERELLTLRMTSEELAIYEGVARLSADATDETKIAVGELTREIVLQRDALAPASEDMKELEKNGKTSMDDLKNAIQGMGREFTDTFAEMVTGGKASFSDLVDSILKDMARLAVQKSITDPLFGWLEGLLGGGGGGGGGIGSIFASVLGMFGQGGVGGGSGTFAGSAGYDMWSVGSFHRGGIAGALTDRRLAPAALFAGAPRYHGGGLAGDEVPAILQRGERVLSREQTRALGGDVYNIKIDARDADPGVEQRLERKMYELARNGILPAAIQGAAAKVRSDVTRPRIS